MINKFDLGENKINFKSGDYVFVTTVTKEFVDFAINWNLSLKNIDEDKNSIIICLDIESYNIIESKNILCVLLEAKNIINNNRADWIENEKYYKAAGPFYLHKKYKLDIISSDTDIVFFKNPVPVLRNEINAGYDLVVVSDKRFDRFVPTREKGKIKLLDFSKKNVIDYGIQDQAKFGEPNGAFGYFPYTEKMTKLWEVFFPNSEYLKEFPVGIEEGAAQTIFNKRLKELDVKYKILSVFDFPNGSVWQVPYLKEKIKNTCYIMHYNFCLNSDPISAAEEKRNWMKEDGNWLLG
jgi:hypothetical protein